MQSACSTSLLTVAQACQTLQLYQCDMALAGGVSAHLPAETRLPISAVCIVSADGHCRTFDASATGTVFGSGAGVVLLKRLDDALADGDHVYAVILGCGVNNDGSAKVGYMAPSVDGQAAAIEMALASAGVDPRSVGYVECHGTATPLGDPIEVAGLTKAYGATSTDRQFCGLGSVKSNIGHLDVAAGVAGLIKAALVLKHRQVPASLHYERPNPQIDFAATPFYVNAQLQSWADRAGPLRAGVSAFGLGGTNVHLVLEQGPATSASAHHPTSDTEPQLLVLSARSEAALIAARMELARYLGANPDVSLADVAYTLQVGRRGFSHRCALVCHSRDEALVKLQATGSTQICVVAESAAAREPVFMFPGRDTNIRIWVGICRV